MSKEQQAQTQTQPASKPMTLEQAFHNIVVACRKYVGIADEHEALQHSLKLVKDALEAQPEKAEGFEMVK